MAELLVNVNTGEVIHVAEDGHKWGRQECRDVYDAYVSALGHAPRAVQREVYAVTRTIRAKGKTLTYDEYLPVPQSEVLVDVPPPSRLGVIKIPGVRASDLAYLAEQGEGGERLRTLALDSTERARILAGKVLRTREEVESAVRGTAVRGN